MAIAFDLCWVITPALIIGTISDTFFDLAP